MRISDWSSDVCSSDLLSVKGSLHSAHMQSILRLKRHFAIGKYSSDLRCLGTVENFTIGPYDPHPEIGVPDENTVKRLTQAIVLRRQIGRASCRERVCQYV